MTLEQRITLALQRVGAAIRERMVPAGGSTGQVLAKQNGDDFSYSWVTPGTGSQEVRLSMMAGSDFLPAERLGADVPYRMIGPVAQATSSTLRYSRVVVPLRKAALGGETIRLAVTEVVGGSTNGNVLLTMDAVLVAGQTTVTFEGPFSVPAGHWYAFMVGSINGAVSSQVSFFYGANDSYAPPHNTTMVALSDEVLIAGGTALSMTPRTGYSRIVLLYGASVTKGIVGPLDPLDFPVVGAVGAVPKGGSALVNDGTATSPVQAFRRADNTLSYGPVMTSSPGYQVPSGGNTNQALIKSNNTSGDFRWGSLNSGDLISGLPGTSWGLSGGYGMTAYDSNTAAATAVKAISMPGSATVRSGFMRIIFTTAFSADTQVWVRIYASQGAAQNDWLLNPGDAARPTLASGSLIYEEMLTASHQAFSAAFATASNTAAKNLYVSCRIMTGPATMSGYYTGHTFGALAF
ncbi:hypothetical protein [Deinococcus fonticola]|uniref:hypothetical protein n=1 Tax=Deinococcus fonticola TaxID=2528713 RepID=UPI001074BCF5|nr:hypothetical protein [Deinococcus fonticola]